MQHCASAPRGNADCLLGVCSVVPLHHAVMLIVYLGYAALRRCSKHAVMLIAYLRYAALRRCSKHAVMLIVYLGYAALRRCTTR
jgi:hypothetical protein